MAFNEQCTWLHKQLGYMSVKNTQHNLPRIMFPSSEGIDYDDDRSIASLALMGDDEFDQLALPTVEQCVAEVMEQPESPRSAYIYGCLSSKMNPRAHLLVRDKLTTVLNLRHQGMVRIKKILWIYLES
jgi:hypothetical protein